MQVQTRDTKNVEEKLSSLWEILSSLGSQNLGLVHTLASWAGVVVKESQGYLVCIYSVIFNIGSTDTLSSEDMRFG